MSYGLQVRDSAGQVIFDSSAYSVRMIFRQVLPVLGNGATVTVSGLDPAKGVIWLDGGGGSGVALPHYSISGNVVTFPLGIPSGGGPYTLYGVQFA